MFLLKVIHIFKYDLLNITIFVWGKGKSCHFGDGFQTLPLCGNGCESESEEEKCVHFDLI